MFPDCGKLLNKNHGIKYSYFRVINGLEERLSSNVFMKALFGELLNFPLCFASDQVHIALCLSYQSDVIFER